MAAVERGDNRRQRVVGGFLRPDHNPIEAGFIGDSMWVSVHSNGQRLLFWADTRGLGGSVEEDIYFAKWPKP